MRNKIKKIVSVCLVSILKALAKGGSVKIKVKKYVRPANEDVMCVYSSLA
jgi:hypothetical protein